MRKSTGSYPSLRVAGSGQRVVSMGGSVLLVTTATMVGLDPMPRSKKLILLFVLVIGVA